MLTYKKNTIWDIPGMRHSRDLRSRLLELCFMHGIDAKKWKGLRAIKEHCGNGNPDPVWVSNTVGKC